MAATFCRETGHHDPPGSGCGGIASCLPALLEGPTLEAITEPDGQFTVRMRVRIKAPHNDTQLFSFAWPVAFWFRGAIAAA